MHYYQFRIGDYYSHTQHLSEMEDLAYRRMLDWMYLHESPLPKSSEQIARLIRMRTHSECIAVVLQEFFDETDYGYEQKAVMEEISAFKGKSEKAKASAKARWAAKPAKSNANALQAESERNANHKPRTNNQEPLKIEGKQATRGTRLPPNWIPDSDYLIEGARIRPDYSTADLYAVGEKFRDYWVGLSGSKAVKVDWVATWRNWLRNENYKGVSNAKGGHNRKLSCAEQQIADARELAAIIAARENHGGAMGADGPDVPQQMDCAGGASYGEWEGVDQLQDLDAEAFGTNARANRSGGRAL